MNELLLQQKELLQHTEAKSPEINNYHLRGYPVICVLIKLPHLDSRINICMFFHIF
jgi:hypothetical protein